MTEAKRNPDCIYNQIEDVLMHAWNAGFAHGYGDGTQPDQSGYPTGEQVAKIRRAVFTDLWKQASDDYGDAVSRAYDELDEQYERNGKVDRVCARAALHGGLVALIGPNPQESE